MILSESVIKKNVIKTKLLNWWWMQLLHVFWTYVFHQRSHLYFMRLLSSISWNIIFNTISVRCFSCVHTSVFIAMQSIKSILNIAGETVESTTRHWRRWGRNNRICERIKTTVELNGSILNSGFHLFMGIPLYNSKIYYHTSGPGKIYLVIK